MSLEHLKARFSRQKSYLLTLAVSWLSFAVTFLVCRARTGGAYVYPLDDSYIHLALAKNIAVHGVYGVTPYEFTPASSSIVWPLVLVAVRALTVSELAPLGINVLLATVLAWVLDGLLAREGYGARGRVLGSLAILAATPILPIVFVGMEHTLHVLAVLLLASEAVRALAGDGERAPRIFLWALLATAARYEGLFLVAILGALALHRRRFSLAFALGAAAAIPVVGYAAFSVAKGGPMLPVSVLIKRHVLDPWTFFPAMGRRLVENPHLLTLLTLLTLAYAVVGRGAASVNQGREQGRDEGREQGRDRRRLLVLVAAGVIALHVVFAQTGWLFRYEAYAVALGLLALSGPLLEHRGRLRQLAVPAALAMIPLVVRGAGALRAVPAASANIYEQQLQMARFVAQYYQGGRVVLGDIGAVTYLADVRIVDLIGLGSPRVAELHLKGGFDLETADKLTREASIAIVDEAYLPPRRWRKVGQWRTPCNVVCRDDAVALYAVQPEEEERLLASLRDFAARLPPSVEQSGPYTEPRAER